MLAERSLGPHGSGVATTPRLTHEQLLRVRRKPRLAIGSLLRVRRLRRWLHRHDLGYAPTVHLYDP